MKFQEAIKLISALPANQAILLIGPPGTGKSTLAEAVSVNDGIRAKAEQGEDAESSIKVCDLACYLPEDLLGVPFKETMKFGNTKVNVTKHAPPSWIRELSTEGKTGVLLLDDIGAAAKSVQVAAFRIVQERTTGDAKLSDNVRIICTTNRREDKSGASTLPSALLNRMVILAIEPDLEEWSKWYAKKGYPNALSAFLQFRPGHLSRLPKEADKRGAFATPRSWEKLAVCYEAASAQDMVFDVARGLVGEGVATELLAFIRTMDKLPNPKAVLEDPVGSLGIKPIREPDKLIAIVTGIAEHATIMKRKDAPLLFMRALAHICSESFEYAGTAVTTYVNRGGDLKSLVKVIRSNQNDKKMMKLLNHLRSALE